MIPLFALLTSSVSAYGLCNGVNYRLRDQRLVNLPIVAGPNLATSVSGTLSVVDGCTFSVSGLTFNGVDSIVWYGGIGEATSTSEPAVRLVAAEIARPSVPINANYTFITSAGSAVSYTDFDQFRLFDPKSGIIVGKVNLPSNGVVPPTVSGRPNPATRPPTPGASATSAAAPSATSAAAAPAPTSGAEKVGSVAAAGIVAAAVAFL